MSGNSNLHLESLSLSPLTHLLSIAHFSIIYSKVSAKRSLSFLRSKIDVMRDVMVPYDENKSARRSTDRWTDLRYLGLKIFVDVCASYVSAAYTENTRNL